MTPIYPTRPKRRRINVSLSDAAWRRLTLYTAQKNTEPPYVTRSSVIEECIMQLPCEDMAATEGTMEERIHALLDQNRPGERSPRADDARATLDAADAARKERHR